MSYQTLDPKTQKAPDNKEGLNIGLEVPAGSALASKPLHGPNNWPDPVRAGVLASLERDRSGLTARFWTPQLSTSVRGLASTATPGVARRQDVKSDTSHPTCSLQYHLCQPAGIGARLPAGHGGVLRCGARAGTEGAAAAGSGARPSADVVRGDNEGQSSDVYICGHHVCCADASAHDCAQARHGLHVEQLVLAETNSRTSLTKAPHPLCRFLDRFKNPMVNLRPLRYGPEASAPDDVRTDCLLLISVPSGQMSRT